VRCRGRNVVERRFNRLKQLRASAARHDKRALTTARCWVIASLLI
jgi:transposase